MWVPSLKNSLVLKMRASKIYRFVLFIAMFSFKPAPKPRYFSEDTLTYLKSTQTRPLPSHPLLPTFAQLFFCSLNVPLSDGPYRWFLVK